MAQRFFLNQTLIQEILLWRSNTGENLLVFEPIARACATLVSLPSAILMLAFNLLASLSKLSNSALEHQFFKTLDI